VIALVDTNADPDEAEYVIPGNDDAIRSCALITRVIANAIAEGKQKVSARDFAKQENGSAPAAAAAPAPEAGEPVVEEAPEPAAPVAAGEPEPAEPVAVEQVAAEPEPAEPEAAAPETATPGEDAAVPE
jgi:small subunit ribosomal protein S2